MSDLRALSADELRTHAESVAREAAQSLGATFGRSWQLQVDPQPSPADGVIPEESTGRGLVVGIRVGDAVLLVLVPDRLPLPEWIAAPDASQSARMQTLAQEWSIQLVPPSLAADDFRAVVADDLQGTCAACGFGADGRTLVLRAVPVEDGAASDESSGVPIVLAWPAARLPASMSETTGKGEPSTAADPPEAPSSRGADDERREAAAREAASRERVRRVMQLPVPVAVRLAEKRVELGTLMGMSPGTLIMFDKSCEDLLGLYVNNQLYALGEAVKIGEKFGLKVGEVGVHVVRSSPLVNA